MVKLFGSLYYIDFDVLDDFLIIEGSDYKDNIQKTQRVVEIFDKDDNLLSKEVIEEDNIKHKEINGVKFEIIRNFIEDLSASEQNDEDYDSALGSRNLKKAPARFKLAFNTLIYYNILRKVD